ncbi:MAG: cytochrome C [Myxococcota bacterium]
MIAVRGPLFRPYVATALCITAAACFDPGRTPAVSERTTAATEVSGEVLKVASERDLDEYAQIAAAKTFVPTGAHDTHLILYATGTSGRLAVAGLPSMRILKYVGVFTPEPWQGFGYDDESMDLIYESRREDLVYSYGDSGQPALSETKGRYDGKALFFVDGANGRVAVLHLDDFETKQIVTNPVFRSSSVDGAVDPETRYLLQTSRFPEIPGGAFEELDSNFGARLRGGLTLWRYERGSGDHGGRIGNEGSFTVLLPPYLQSQTDAGKAVTKGKIYTVAACAQPPSAFAGMDRCPEGAPGILHVVDVLRAQAAAQQSSLRIGSQVVVDLESAVERGVLKQYELPPAPRRIGISPDGRRAVVTHEVGAEVTIVELTRLDELADRAKLDAFGVPTVALEELKLLEAQVGGPSVDVTFSGPQDAFVSVHEPPRIVRIHLDTGRTQASIDLETPPGRLTFPGGRSAEPKGTYLVSMNKSPSGRLPGVGPHKPMNPMLFDVAEGEITPLYEGSVPQATDLAGLALSADLLDPIVRYPAGTDTRTNELAPYATLPGNERVEREGNRVHVFGTLIRSHITPEITEVEVGDVVTFHLTNLEQAQDQTHGFTVSTYNVHGSWEPGKVASVTFTADREGIFPYYCTEFCSALHLEMMGYLLVRPEGYEAEDEGSDAVGIDLAPDEAKHLFEQKMTAIAETQKVIENVVEWLEENDYESNPKATALVMDATNQLAEVPQLERKIEEALRKKDYNTARLWAEQTYMYQVKAADAGLRAQKIMKEAK